jgi:predicted TIM-barrel fold metal-dependent hydrolase
MMKIDIYAHLITQKVIDAFTQRVGTMGLRPDETFDTKMCDLNKRFGIMEKFPGLAQVLIPTGQPLEVRVRPEDAVYIARVYNDELAELVGKYPTKFLAAVACLPLNDLDATMKEIDRTIKELGFKGILINTPLNGRAIDAADLMPIYERMASYDLPIWIHPIRFFDYPDYSDETASKYGLYHVLGWPYETTVAMCRLACSGVLAKFPNLKFITHHAGGVLPFISRRLNRVNPAMGQEILSPEELKNMKPPMEQLRMFYNDTALYGNVSGLMCAHEFFGTGHLLFGTDAPYGPMLGEQYTRWTIEVIDAMSIPDAARAKIYEGNARALLHLG